MTSARRVGGVIKRLFRWAAEEDLIPTDPGATLRLPGRELVRERTLTDAEIRALWHVTDPANDPLNLNKAGRVAAHPSQWPWGPFFRLALLLGQRRGELAVMKWSAIDMNARTWAMTSGETKSKRAHLIPLSDAATHILANMPRFEGCDFVFTTTGEGPIKDFSGSKALLDKTMGAHMEKQGHKLEPWRLHDLRRTCSTNLAALKVDPFIRRRVLNHALEGVDKIYDRYDYLDEKRAALDLWAARVGEIVAGGPSGDAAGGNVVQFRRRAKA
jgi:integrase